MATEIERNEHCAHRILDYVMDNFAQDPAKGFESVLIGNPDTPAVTAPEPGAELAEEPFWSVKARQIDLLSMLLNRLILDVEKGRLQQLWSGRAESDREVARALWQLNAAAGASNHSQANVSPQALALAQLIGRYQEIARKAQNRFAPLAPFPGSLVSQSHDPLRLRRAGKAEWVAFIRPMLDAAWVEGRADLSEVLGDAWELIVQVGYVDLPFQFKNADDWTDYNARFGFGTLREAVVAGLERAARRSGLLEVFGTEPDATLKGMIFALGKAGMSIEEEQVSRLQIMLAGLAPARPLGLHNPAVELDVAEGAAAELIDLSVALLPEPEDLPVFLQDAASPSTALFAAVDAELMALVSAPRVQSQAQKATYAAAVAVFCRGFKATLVEGFEAADNPPGKATELLGQFLKLDVSNWWREAMRRAALLALRQFIGGALKASHAELDPSFASALELYGVTSAGWEAQRAKGSRQQGDETHSAEISKATSDGINSHLWERLMFIALAPDAPDHARFGRGIAERNAEGELLRFMSRFRELRAPALPHLVAEPVEEAESRPQAPVFELADVLTWLMLITRCELFASGLGEGLDHGAEPWFNTAWNCGAVGLCADFLVGETTGLKAAPLTVFHTVRHPSIAPALALWRRARYAEDTRDELTDWAQKIGDQGAVENMQRARQVLNGALLRSLQKAVQPGK